MILQMTQYMRPDGREKTVEIDIPSELDGKVIEIQKAGLNFTCEVLSIGSVAIYISDDENEEDLACEITENGPGEKSPRNCLIRMIENFTIPVKTSSNP